MSRAKAKLTLLSIAIALLLTARAGAQLPKPGMKIDPANTALVITDPQNDSLTPEGVAWELVAKSVEENNTIENIETHSGSPRPVAFRFSSRPTTTSPRTTAGSSREAERR